MTKKYNKKSSIKKISEIINLLGRILGLVIKEQEGTRLYNKVEQIRILFGATFFFSMLSALKPYQFR